MPVFPELRPSGLASALLLAFLGVGVPALAQEPPPPPTHARVISVYDGDTFTLDTGDRVRLRGVNTPELKPYEPFAAESRDATESFLIGKEITLSYGSTIRDHYGRLLAQASVDGQDLSQYLVERGLAHVFLVAPTDEDVGPLLDAQREAREAKRGLWSTQGFQGTLHITSFHANGRGDERLDVNAEYLRVCNITADPVDLTGYKITDLTGHSWDLPGITIPAGFTFEIRSGKGEDAGDPTKALKVYLDNDYPIWNNDHDRATLLDPAGKVQDLREHQPKSRQD